MVDVLTSSQRSFCMSQIRSKNTKPEIALRKALWHCGFRYRVKNSLPGRPDIVFSGSKTAIFVDGCFWHKCPDHFVYPKNRAGFWREKIEGNVQRDRRVEEMLRTQGWFALRFWEHEIMESPDDCVRRVAEILEQRRRI
ncbi:very short patch repair endonuclease [Marinobacter pelagius]|uniref:Very short patch repair endonuclease n=1 Tax=Marinobacter pelagius TaxID=379482 RepID=A0A1I4ZZR9_9GAMM|nr:very short patch repair endonuclease [Marinobacter pelagius]SFN55734.1 T/G mismatch-specific endonuclease [Marinobacter pelagius]